MRERVSKCNISSIWNTRITIQILLVSWKSGTQLRKRESSISYSSRDPIQKCLNWDTLYITHKQEFLGNILRNRDFQYIIFEPLFIPANIDVCQSILTAVWRDSRIVRASSKALFLERDPNGSSFATDSRSLDRYCGMDRSDVILSTVRHISRWVIDRREMNPIIAVLFLDWKSMEGDEPGSDAVRENAEWEWGF